jgi:hypothetical protein
MKFVELNSNTVLSAHNFSDLYYLFFIKEIRDDSVVIGQLTINNSSQFFNIQHHVIPTDQWNDAFNIYYSSKLASEQQCKRFIRGVFGVPMVEKR